MPEAAKHTPGPWRLAPHYKCGWQGIAKDPTPNKWQGIYEPIHGQEHGSRSAIVSVGIRGGEVDDYWLNISEANANLIASAPDMLTVLRDLYEWQAGSNILPLPLWDQLRACLARAEGKDV